MSIDGVETFRGTMQGRTPEGYDATVIVLRRGEGSNGRIWLTFNGAIKTTVVMTDPQAGELVGLLGDAQRVPDEQPQPDQLLDAATGDSTPATGSREVTDPPNV